MGAFAWIMLHESRVMVAWQQRHQWCRFLGGVRRPFSCAPIAMGHPGFWPCPPRAVPIGWPERQRSTSHVAKMLNQFERMELDVLDCARTIVPRHPRSAQLLAGEFQYSCNRRLCVHSDILTHRRGRPEAPTYQCCCCRIARGRSAMRRAVEHVRPIVPTDAKAQII